MYPDVAQLEAFPYQTNPALFDLEYAAMVSEQMPEESEAYDLGIPWHDVMGWLFDLAEAHYILMIEMRPDDYDEVQCFLNRVTFRPSPMLSGPSDLNDRAFDAYLVLANKYHGMEVPA